MNFTTLKSRVQLNAGNLTTSHPVVANVAAYVNDGLRFTITRASAKWPNFQLFPEHTDVEWTDITVADQAYLALPNDQMAVQRAYSSDSSSSPNLNNTQWRLLSYIDPEAYDQLSKPTTNIAYPSLWTVREGKALFHPTPRTTKTTYVKLDGVQEEPDMSGGTDSPRTAVRWHPAVIDFASYLMCNDLGWADDAARFLAAGDEKIATVGATMIGMRRYDLRKKIRIASMPRGY